MKGFLESFLVEKGLIDTDSLAMAFLASDLLEVLKEYHDEDLYEFEDHISDLQETLFRKIGSSIVTVCRHDEQQHCQ